MKKTGFLFGLLFIVPSFSTYSQNERNIWYFGDHAGLDFNYGEPIALTNNAMRTLDNCTSLSDSLGDLMFYSNGEKVWNRHHEVMPNGEGLLGDTTCTNGALAVKQPGHSDIYYLFTNDAFAGPSGLRYSVVDMRLNNGDGDVTAKKNILLLVPNTEKVLAIYHQNNQDIWIIAHEWNSDAFRAYLLTENGLDTTPVISHVGSNHTGGTYGTYNSMGQISGSPDRSKIGLAIYDFQQYELFDFDNAIGILSNPIVIPGYPNSWGVEFSPDGTKLYTTRWKYSPVYQFDISSNNATTIINSVVQIGEATGPNPNYKAGFLQLGPDGKIYVAKWESDYLALISYPNESGSLCGFEDNGVFLDNRLCKAGLPTFIKPFINVGLENGNNQTPTILFYPNPVHDHLTIQIYSKQGGSINVELLNLKGQFIASIFSGTIPKDSQILPINLDTRLPVKCKSGLYILSVSIDGNRILRKVTIITID